MPKFDKNLVRIGWFLGWRQLKRASLWSNILIVLIMILTFLNLVVVSGILVGLIEGSVFANKNYYIGELLITPLKEKDYIEKSQNILANISLINGIENVTARYRTAGTIESNYKLRTNFEDEPEDVSTIIVGIDPDEENDVTTLSQLVVEGEYLNETDFDQVLIGSSLLRRYLDIESPGFELLDDVFPGTKVRLSINGQRREVTVKGILKSKVDEVDRRVFMVDSQLRSMISRSDLNVGEISLRVDESIISPDEVKSILVRNGFDKNAKIQTFEEAQPKFLQDIKDTFALLGSIISSIGLVVASITVFIVIFINAITRRKYIGIMKGIGVHGGAIEMSYVFQSLIYALIGSAVGLLLVYLVLIPYFQNNPIDFPFSDGILVAPIRGTAFRVGLLVLATALAGYIPAKMIVKKNTLDSILGRR
jgi:ABC-type lipoprotein release transport system permease subunit